MSSSPSAAAAARILILSGAGRYADPWHPYPETSAALAEVLGGLDGVDVSVDEHVDERLTRLDDVDLLVINTGNPAENGDAAGGADDAQREAVADSVARFRALGGAVLVSHSGTSSLADYPDLVALMPARWVPEHSWHPEFGTLDLPVSPDVDHPVTAGIDRVVADDELYSDLVIDDSATVLLSHELEGRRHPLVLAAEPGGTRVVVDALGHDGRSYRSPSHRALLQQAAEWLLRRR